MNDRLRRVFDVVSGLLRSLDEDRRQGHAAERVVALSCHGGDDDRRTRDAREVRGDRRERSGLAEEHDLDVVELLRARAQIHHQPDHLVAAERLEHLSYRSLGRQESYVLVRAVRHEQIHEALVLELVGDDVERHLVGDACAADLEVAEVHRDEDQPSPVIVRGPEVRPGSRIDRDEPREVRGPKAREPHDLRRGTSRSSGTTVAPRARPRGRLRSAARARSRSSAFAISPPRRPRRDTRSRRP